MTWSTGCLIVLAWFSALGVLLAMFYAGKNWNESELELEQSFEDAVRKARD